MTSRIMMPVAVIRFLAIGLLSPAMLVPFLWHPRGDGFEHARLTALTALVLFQVVTVPIGLVMGTVLGVTQPPQRPPGYAFGAITTAFGLLIARWVPELTQSAPVRSRNAPPRP
jgi:hypothetical protein